MTDLRELPIRIYAKDEGTFAVTNRCLLRGDDPDGDIFEVCATLPAALETAHRLIGDEKAAWLKVRCPVVLDMLAKAVFP